MQKCQSLWQHTQDWSFRFSYDTQRERYNIRKYCMSDAQYAKICTHMCKYTSLEFMPQVNIRLICDNIIFGTSGIFQMTENVLWRTNCWLAVVGKKIIDLINQGQNKIVGVYLRMILFGSNCSPEDIWNGGRKIINSEHNSQLQFD